MLLTLFLVNGYVPVCSSALTLTIVNNIPIASEIYKSGGSKDIANGDLEFEQATQSVFGLKNNFYIALW